MADKKTLKQIDIGKADEKDKTGEAHHLCLMSFCGTTNQVIMPERRGKVDKYYVKKRERKDKTQAVWNQFFMLKFKSIGRMN
jgi:hypothetical protein